MQRVVSIMFAARVVDDPSGRLCPPEDRVGVSDRVVSAAI